MNASVCKMKSVTDIWLKKTKKPLICKPNVPYQWVTLTFGVWGCVELCVELCEECD